jgi:hypothetical protein
MISADTMQVTVRGQDNTWVGIGYGLGMVNMDMNIIEFLSNGKYTLRDAYASNTSSFYFDTDYTDGRNDLTDATYTRECNNPQIVFQRKLNTGDSKDNVLSIVIMFLILGK